MSTPQDYPFTAGFDLVNLRELRDGYRTLAKGLNGFDGSFRPIVAGSGNYGDNANNPSTYTTCSGYYSIYQNKVDVWYTLNWTNHTGTGNLLLVLPVNAMGSSAPVWTASCFLTGAVMSNASSNYISVRAGTNLASVLQNGGLPVAMNESGGMSGHITYKLQISTR